MAAEGNESYAASINVLPANPAKPGNIMASQSPWNDPNATDYLTKIITAAIQPVNDANRALFESTDAINVNMKSLVADHVQVKENLKNILEDYGDMKSKVITLESGMAKIETEVSEWKERSHETNPEN